MPALFRRLRARLKYRHFDRDLAQELEVHRAMKQDELEAAGRAARDARAASLRALGNVTFMREEARSVWISRWLQGAWQDLRYAARQLRRFPAYSFGAALVLAIGVATSTVVFSAVNATLLRPWPVDDPGGLVLIDALPSPDGQYNSTSAAEARYLSTHASTVTDLSTFLRGGTVFAEPHVDVQSNAVTPSYFAALRVGVFKGRLLTAEDDQPGATPVGVISYRLWETAFSADPGVIGRTVRIMNAPLTIVGVLEQGFEDVHRMRIDLWVPQGNRQDTVAPHLRAAEDLTRPVNIVARLATGVDASKAAIELQALSHQFRRANNLPLPELAVRSTRPIDSPAGRGDARQLMLLFPAAALLMLLVGTNVGGLVLARTSARLRELAVRRALGASRARVSRQIFTEVLVLALGAGALGLIAAQALPHALGDRLRTEHFAPDATVFIAAFLLSVVAALIAATSALLRIRRISVSSFIARQYGADASAARARAILIATQLAISTAVLTAAGLMTRAVVHASETDPGFDVDGVQVFRLASGQTFRLGRGPNDSLARWLKQVEQWRTEVSGISAPGLAFASHPPVSRSISQLQIRKPDEHVSTRRQIADRSVSASYFDVLGIRITEGRTLSESPGVQELVVSEAAARWLWPADPAIGQRLIVRQGPDEVTFTVVGVVKDVATRNLGSTEPTLYTACGSCDVVLSRDAGQAVAAQLTAAAARVDSSFWVRQGTVRQNLADEGTSDLQDASTAAWIVGLSALGLSLIGAFGVLAYTVEERRREIGIRIALGGQGWPVALGVMAAANRPALWGIGLGVIVAAILATLLRHEVFGLAPLDPLAYGLVILALLPPLALAAIIPARRATRVDPAITLRHD